MVPDHFGRIGEQTKEMREQLAHGRRVFDGDADVVECRHPRHQRIGRTIGIEFAIRDAIERAVELAGHQHVALEMLHEAATEQFSQPPLGTCTRRIPTRSPLCARNFSTISSNSVMPQPAVASVRA